MPKNDVVPFPLYPSFFPLIFRLDRYIPNAVLPRLENGQPPLAEIRDVSVVFVNLHGIRLQAGPTGATNDVSDSFAMLLSFSFLWLSLGISLLHLLGTHFALMILVLIDRQT